MPSTTAESSSSNMDKARQVSCLCILLLVINNTCKAKDNIQYASGDADGDTRLTQYQTFLHKLAQICNSQKGGDTETALIPVKGRDGPEYNLVSNSKKGTQRAEKFLASLLKYVGSNPENLKDKAFQKKILWQIMEFNSPRINEYLKKLLKSLDECIHDCIRLGDADDSEILKLLKLLEDKAKFPQDVNTSTNARNKYLSDCETLIKAIQYYKTNEAEEVIRVRADGDDPDKALSWCQLRHHLGRLYSYRHAADVIVRASKDWPRMFQNFTFRCVPSSLPQKAPISRASCNFQEILHGALSEEDIAKYASDIVELQSYDLDAIFHAYMDEIPRKTIVHCEIVLHDDLIRREIIDASQFEHDCKFIATSKPTCRLCHFYFENSINDFEVQSSHMNIYPKWRLPELDDDQDPEVVERHEDTLDDIIQHLQRDVMHILRKKLATWRRHDSRTDSRGGRTTAGTYARSEMSDLQSNRGFAKGRKAMKPGSTEEFTHPPLLDEEDWTDDMYPENEDDAV